MYGDESLKFEVQAAAKLVQRTNPVIFDVGANTGIWTKLFLTKRPDAQIFLFEPERTCCAAITRLDLPNTRLIAAAVGRRKGTQILHAAPGGGGVSSLYPHKDTPSQHFTFSPVEVPVVCIDDVVEEFQLKMIDFVKMDIEGAELDALHGAAATLRDGKIGALSFEFGCSNLNSRTFFRDFWDVLNPFGFSTFRLTPGGPLIPITEYREDLEYFKHISNYVATRPKACESRDRSGDS